MKTHTSVAICALLTFIVGCGGSESDAEPRMASDSAVETPTTTAAANSRPATSTLQSEGGRVGPVLYGAEDSLGGDEALIAGVVRLVDGCLLIESETSSTRTFVALWPFGTIWDDAESTVVLSDGTRISPGDVIEGGGGYGTITSATEKSASLREGLSSCLTEEVTQIANMQYLPIEVVS